MIEACGEAATADTGHARKRADDSALEPRRVSLPLTYFSRLYFRFQ